MKRILLILICAALFSIAHAGEKDRYTIILSMDGFRWDLAENAFTPTLDSIRSVGVYAELYPCFPSNTFPNHYSMATGLHPDTHGIVNNSFYDRRLNKYYAISDRTAVEDPDFWGGEPIWNTAQRQGMIANIFMWPGSETKINGSYASVWTRYDGSIPFTERADWLIDALHRPIDSIPNLIMWYFEEPDLCGHRQGPESERSREMIEKIDSVIGYFLCRARTSPVFDRINFIFTSDHGMSSLSVDKYINLYDRLDNSKINYFAASTPLFLEPDSAYVEEAYNILKNIDHLQVFKRDSMPEKYHYGHNRNRITSLVVLPETGWIADYRPTDRPKTGGGHGFDPFDRDMSMVFYAFGPDFKYNYRQQSFQNLNVYLLLCKLLDIEPAWNECEEDAFKDMLQ